MKVITGRYGGIMKRFVCVQLIFSAIGAIDFVTAVPGKAQDQGRRTFEYGLLTPQHHHHHDIHHGKSRRTFEVDYKAGIFRKDGKEFRYVAGEMHYFRIPRAYWQDRLRKAKYAGLNAISTYVEWSLHETAPDQFDFSGENDVAHFIRLAQEEGLFVLLRPGPYICTERSLGGLPPWLMTVNPYMRLRSSDASFLFHVERWFKELFSQLRSLLYGSGGPIIMVQVENEYGSFNTCDSWYMAWLRDKLEYYVKNAALLYTTDGNADIFFKCGPIPGVFATVDFGPQKGNLSTSFEPMIKHNKGGPMVNSEFYTGWITHWSETFSTAKTEDVVETMKQLLKLKASFSLYMIHGGTNFGFKAGANTDPYRPTTTSYDYDAPVTEAGDLTNKYFAIRNVLKEFSDSYNLDFNGDKPAPSNSSKGNYGRLKFSSLASLFNAPNIADGDTIQDKDPLSFEALGTYYGYVLYETDIPGNLPDPPILSMPYIRDRAYVYVDEEPRAILDRQQQISSTPLWAYNARKLSILVENQAYVNYDSELQGDFKGIVSSARLGEETLQNWNMTRISLSNISSLDGMPPLQSTVRPPAFYEANFILPDGPNPNPKDTFLDPTGWGKGAVFLNGLNLGRYWPNTGPQVTLYVPGCYLKPYPEVNKVVIFELEQIPLNLEMQFIDVPKLKDGLLKDQDGDERSDDGCQVDKLKSRHFQDSECSS